MPRPKRTQDTTMLSMALVGYEMEKQKIDEKIREIRGLLGGRASSTTASTEAPATTTATKTTTKTGRPKRTLSPAARKRIAAAQKKRWAEHRKKLAGSAAE